MKASLTLLAASLLLAACASPLSPPDSGIQPPPAWQSLDTPSVRADNQQWWTHFGSPQLNRLIEQARLDSHDLGAAMARVRQAQASAVIAGAPLLPELQLGLDASRQRLLRGDGNDQLDASSSERTSTSFGLSLIHI